ncbi:glutamate-1-semialdehyde 2,1-aminomutase [Prosthecochloris sp. N3]|uniref:Glutamate-1-semialdehyde 2,1-aminomutase n=1 Tax=Prosthecochloris ethylica TaxID=2743976 RepID=A0ABR9XQY2_9CHLB|nr:MULTISPECIES: glutamate-1-semialdehyde 2,1-aminomutase [Prosthecochloris]MBF0586344.1 glutamate-1-semialdehyde 2,1-aminomutase [Prosthecochloris ethylica]MBF0636438.1 glutamate-1-semialdehyde 2,1-aminomutase [Prosthecochloris ethylica]NUK47612.1 glutamate-1-semialdehyde 2,1-aminomutase [Prosthecochloris ethylica]RNA64154.1 glutamate-1-semialdehyde-2,1-aminomutase [Prosthecochloris sp. ZM_2]
MPQLTRSAELFEKAKQFIPGGVNSPVRAFKSVGGTPVFMEKGQGAYMTDVDGNTYIDYVGSWGPFILGSMHPKVTAALEHTLTKIGTSFGTPIEMEIEIAELLTNIVPSLDMVRMVNSGTEATMSAVRLARGYTGRDKIIKFEGCYHGHGDSFLIKAGSGALTLGTPDSPGVTKGTANDTLNAKYNDLESVRTLVNENKDNIAAVIIEPVAGNTGVIPAKREFLQGLRDLCTEEGIVLIFDEVMCGFRVALGGAQELYGITPDLTTMGKIIGGGLPVGAFGGKRELMERIAPLGDVYQAGTLSGNPLALTAGLATLKVLRDENPYPELERKASVIEEGFKDNMNKLGLNYTQNRVGSMACLFFTDKPVENHDDAVGSDLGKYSKYYQSMLDQGIYLAPSQFEAMFTSAAHSDEDIEKTIKANYVALQAAEK